MKINKKINSLWLVLLLPVGLILVSLSKKNPDMVERLYSSGIYKYIGSTLSIITGALPFSLGEIIVIFSIIFIVISIIKLIYRIATKGIKSCDMLSYSKKVLIAFSAIYFIFNIIWGINYYRLSFSQIANIDTRPATIIELEALCSDLIDKTNNLKTEIQLNKENMAGKTKPRYILKNAYKGYDEIKYIYPELKGSYGKPKGVLFSKAMSYMGITGIYFPFTGEANVNIDIPHVLLPSTATHEMAHQRGFAREDEANYIAYLTCKLHPDLNFQYSGHILALIHSMNVLYRDDREKHNELSKKMSDNVKKDFIEINKYWEKYEGPIEEASNKMNNVYLKSNNQKDGVKSYGRMVDLLIAEYMMKNR